MKLFQKRDGPHVLLLAGVHGDEFEPMITAIELASELTDKLLTGKVTIVSVTNKSAYAIGSRYGRDFLNPARICPGRKEGSILEKYAFQVSSLIKTADYLCDLHTGGLPVNIFPFVRYMMHKDEKILNQHRKMAVCFNMPLIWGTPPHSNGRTISVARDFNVPEVYLEYGGGSGFRNEVVKAYKASFLNFLGALKMIDAEG